MMSQREIIRAFLETVHVDQYELAERAGVSASTVSRYLRGLHGLKRDSAIRLVDACTSIAAEKQVELSVDAGKILVEAAA